MSILWESKQGIKGCVPPRFSNRTCSSGLLDVRGESVIQAVGLYNKIDWSPRTRPYSGVRQARHGGARRLCYEVVRKEYERLRLPAPDADLVELSWHLSALTIEGAIVLICWCANHKNLEWAGA